MGNYGNLISSDSAQIFIHSGISSTITGSFTPPGIAAHGLAITSAGNLISADWDVHYIYTHSGLSSVLTGSFNAPDSSPRGLVIDANGNLISSDSSFDGIFKHSGISSTLTGSFASPSSAPFGITILNGNLISCDTGKDYIFKHNGITATLTGSFASPSDNTKGLTVDLSGNLISCDSSVDYIYTHSGISAVLTGSFATPGGLPSALTLFNVIIPEIFNISITDSLTITESFTKQAPPQSYNISSTDSIVITEEINIWKPGRAINIDIETLNTTDTFITSKIERSDIHKTYAKYIIESNIINDVLSADVRKSMNDFDSTSSFSLIIDNFAGKNKNKFSLNDEIEIYADLDINPPTTKILLGIIENINYTGIGLNEKIEISGRDYGVILQDIIINPRIYKNKEVSDIIKSLMIQNATGRGITVNNVNTTTTTIEKITFNNISLFDTINQLAQLSGFYFYIDVNKDLHFEERNLISSGETFDSTNVTDADFTTTDSNIANKVMVYGDRTLTGAREVFGPGEVTTGSVYILDAKPSNVVVIGSGNVVLQPGGIIHVNNPKTENIKWLVDYDNREVILTSGLATGAGNNIGWAGSGVTIDYQQNTPIIAVRQDFTSQTNYGRKDKTIIDRNIKTLTEAQLKANSYITEHSNPVIMGNIEIFGVCNITPGNTCVVDLQHQNIYSQTYSILEARYKFNKRNNLSNQVLSLKLNKKKLDFIDYFKQQELRLRSLEGAQTDTSVIELSLATGSLFVQVDSYKVISRGIGSAFYFHVPNHNLFNSPSSLLGDMRTGSTVISYP